MSRLEYFVVGTLVLLMPFHYYICEIFLRNTSIDNLWRDVLIFFLAALLLIRKNFVLHLNSFWCIEFLYVLILFFYASISIAVSQNSPSNILGTLRVYIMPIIWGYCISQLNFSKKQICNILKGFVYIMAMEGYYGFFQAFFLGDKFLVALGYPSYEGYLYGSSYYINYFFGNQRAVGTFVSPNPFGQVCAIALCVLLYSDIDLNIKHKTFAMLGLIIGLIGSFSRSSILGFICAFFYIHYKLRKSKKRTPKKNKNRWFFILCIGVVFFIVIDNTVLGGLVANMFISLVHNTVSGNDLSANAHLEQLYKPLSEIFTHPLGADFGNHGPLASAYSSDSTGVESSFYLMGYEMGILGMLFTIFPFLFVLIDSNKKRKYCFYYLLPTTIIVLVFIGYLVLPNIQTYEISFYFYFFVGLYFNENVRTLANADLSDRRKSFGFTVHNECGLVLD